MQTIPALRETMVPHSACGNLRICRRAPITSPAVRRSRTGFFAGCGRRFGHDARMRRAIYPGSFDPITKGHLDVIERAAHLFDELVVAVAFNDQKRSLFSAEERVAMIQSAVDGRGKVRVTQFTGLLVKFAEEQEAVAVVRGLRAVSDFEFEFQMALMNRKLLPTLETIFVTPREEYTYLSSRIVKEIARLGGNVESFVPPSVAQALAERFAQQHA
jgi:pantetheine-phosphate adenylyltransferase